MAKKRGSETREYEKVKAQKKDDLIQEGEFKCFFSDNDLDPEIEWPWHHLLGRRGSLLYQYDNFFPCIHEYHMQYHEMDVARLMETDWYKPFLGRLQAGHSEAWLREGNRLRRAGYSDVEDFLLRLEN